MAESEFVCDECGVDRKCRSALIECCRDEWDELSESGRVGITGNNYPTSYSSLSAGISVR